MSFVNGIPGLYDGFRVQANVQLNDRKLFSCSNLTRPYPWFKTGIALTIATPLPTTLMHRLDVPPRSTVECDSLLGKQI